MPPGTMLRTCAAAAVSVSVWTLVLSAPNPASAAIKYRTVALTGDTAPSNTPGAIYSSFETPVINGSGHIAFGGSFSGPGVSSSGVWLEETSSLNLVASIGGPAPGTELNVVYNGLNFAAPVLNDTGQIAFGATLTGPGVDTTNNGGIWSGRPGDLKLVARRGEAVQGAEPGVVYRFLGNPVFNDVGQAAFYNRLTGTGVNGANDHGISSEGSGSLQLIARDGDPAPGTNPQELFALFAVSDDLVINRNGQTTFFGELIGPSVNHTNNNGIWATSEGTPSLLVREGEAAPGTPSGVVFHSLASPAFGSPTINGSGQILFTGILEGPGVNSSNMRGIWLMDGDSFRLIARTGDLAPGTNAGEILSGVGGAYQLNGAGQTAFLGGLSGPGVDFFNNGGLWLENSGSLKLIAREADAAPGSGGLAFRSLDAFILNGVGQIAFEAVLIGAGATLSNNDGIWATDPNGEITLIAREGDMFDVNDDPLIDDLRTVNFLHMVTGSGGEDGRSTSFNDAGQLVFRLGFTDGTSGIFVATIGLPGDLNADGFVGIEDLTAVLSNWNQAVAPDDPFAGDPTGDGFVGIEDLNLVLGNWNAGTLPPAQSLTNVPEPASLLISISFLGLLIPRRIMG